MEYFGISFGGATHWFKRKEDADRFTDNADLNGRPYERRWQYRSHVRIDQLTSDQQAAERSAWNQTSSQMNTQYMGCTEHPAKCACAICTNARWLTLDELAEVTELSRFTGKALSVVTYSCVSAHLHEVGAGNWAYDLVAKMRADRYAKPSLADLDRKTWQT